MTAPGPKVLFLLASSVEQERCQQLLAEAPTWQGAVISPGDVAATIGIAPDIVVMDRASDEAYWQTGQTGATSPLAVVWLLEDEDTWRSPADEPVAIYDYLYKSQLTAARLGLTIQNLWRQCHLQRQLDHCHHRDEVLDHAGVGINQADASGRYIRVNQQFCTLLGYTEAELLQLTYQAVTHPDDLEAQVEIERQIFGGNLASHTFEKRYLTKAGDPVWTRVTLSAIYDANHRPVSDLAVVEDINIRVSLEKQRHQAEADLKAQRDFLQVLLDHLPISLFVKQAHPDRFGEFVLVNSVCESFFGQQREQIIGKTDYDLFTAEQAAAFAEVDRQVMASQDTQTLEEVVDRPHVGLQTLHTVKVPIYDADQRPQYLLGISLDITAQRQAEHALRAHQQFVQRITENSPNAIYIYDLTQHRYTFVNREIYSLLGYAKEDVNEQMQGAALALMHPDEQEPLTQHLARLSTLSDGEFAEIEYRIRHKNGEWRWFLSRDRVFQRDEAGRVTQVLGNAQDITSIKQSQLALKESEALYSDMMCSLDSASVVRFRVTAEGHWEREYQSPGCESVFGYTAAELCQDSTLWRSRVEATDLERVIDPLLDTFFDHRTATAEYRFHHGDGSLRWIASTYVLRYDETRHHWLVTAIAYDITDRKLTKQALEKSEEQLRLALEFGHVALWDWDAATEQITWNPIGYEIFGYQEDEIELTYDFWRQCLHPDDRQAADASITQSIAEQRNLALEYRILRPDGTQRWIFDTGRGIYDDTGAFTRAIGIALDITDRKQAELERQQTTEELHRFFAVALDLLCIANVDGYFLRLNPAWEAALGYAIEELTQQPFIDFVHPDDVPSTLDAIAQLQAQQEIRNFVNRYRHRDGSYRWLEWRSIPVGDLIYAAARDITDRQRTEQRIRHQNALLAQIARGEPLADILPALVQAIEQQLPSVLGSILLLDDNNRLRYGASHKLPAIYLNLFDGVEIGDGVGSCGTAAWRRATTLVADIAQDPLWRDYRELALSFDLRACWSFPITGSGGQVLGVFGIYTPTSGFPQAEEQQTIEQIVSLASIAIERQRSEVAVKTSEARFRQIAETVCEGFYVVDLEAWHDSYFNPAFTAITGFSEAAICHDRDFWLNHIHRDDRDRINDIVQRDLMQGLSFDEEYRFIRLDGEIRWLRSQCFPIVNQNGIVTRIIGTVEDISDRKQAEAALRESEQRYATLAELSPNAVYRFDAQGQCVYVNPRWCEMTGRTVEQGYGDDWIQVLHPEDRDRLLAGLQEAFDQRTYLRNQGRHLLPDGSVIWFDAQIAPELDEKGNFLGFVGTLTDITEIKQAEFALRASEARFKRLAEACPGVIFTLVREADGTFHFEYLSPAFEALHEIPVETAYQDAAVVFNQIHPDDRPGYEQAAQESIGTLQTFHYECRFVTPSGLKWLQISTQPSHREGQQVTVCYGIALEITHRKQAELALRVSEERYATLVENSPIGVFRFDPAGECVYVNPRWCEMTGRTLATAGGNQWPEILHPNDRERLLATWRAALAQHTKFRAEGRHIHTEGNIVWFDCQMTPEVDHQGNLLGYVGTVSDITDRKQAEFALHNLNAELEARVHQRTQELARSEQDLRTIFNNVYDAIFLHDLDGTIIDINDRAIELLGATREQLVGAFVADISSQDAPVVDDLPQIFQRARQGESLRLEWIGQRLDNNHTFDLEVSVRQVTLGEQTVILAGARDISDRKQAEAALQESRNMLELVLNAIPQRVFWKDRHSTYLGCNSPFAHDNQLAPTDIVGKVDTDFYQAERASLYQQEDQQVISTRAAKLNYEELLTTPQGEQLWLRTSKIPLTNSQGEVVGILGCYEDINDRKQAELALQESEERLRLALLAANQGLYDLDLTTGEVVVSPTYATMLGHDPANFQETFTKWQQRMHPADRERMDQHVKAYLTGQIPEYYVEFRQQLPDGTYKWILSMAKIVAWDEAGQPQRVIGTHADIQERKQAEADLQESRNMLELVLNAIPQRVFWKDRNSKFLGCNPAFAHDYRLTSADIIGKTDSELPWAEWAELYNGDDQEIIKTQTPRLNYEEPGTNFQGEPIWLRTSKIPLTNSQGEVVGILGCYEDITDRKQTELALQESEARFRQIANSINEVFWLTTPDHKILYVSPAYEQVWGRSAEAITADSWLESLHPDDRDQLLTQVDAALPQFPADLLKPNSEVEYRIVRPDGAVRWIRDRAFPIYDDQGQIYRIAGVAEDITDRKSLEQEQQRLLSILEAAPDHIGLVTPDGTVIWNNRQAKLIRGLPLDADVTHYPIESYHPQWALEIIQQVGLPTAMQQGFWLGETALLSADDTEIPVSQFILAHRGPTGEVEYLSTIIRDISLLKQAEQTLRQTNTDLENRIAERTAELLRARDVAETANQAKSIFLANMSHELRTPLNAILGFSQLMGRDQTLSSKHIENLQVINRSGEHLLALINDILEMSKIEAGQVTFNPEPFDLPQLLASLIEMLQLKAESKGLALSQVSGSEVPQYIYTDSNKLRQVLLNLVGNAIKFTQRGYVTLRVTPTDLAGQPVPPQLCHHTAGLGPTTALQFEVEDSGVGIAPEELSQLFEPFVQTASGRLSQEGTGLGLPISQQFVQMMGGDLTVTSQPHVGSTFAFTVPVQLVKPAAVELSEVPRRVVAIAPAQPAYRILIVEDNWANRLLLQNLLADLGFTVKMAENGQDAIGHWQHWQPHLIFMDIRMPVMNGYEATHIIRQREQGQQQATKIICLTAGIFEDAHTDFDAAGFDDCIYKPIQQRDVTTAIAQHLGVEFLYETATPAAQASSNAATVALTAETLQVLPQNWLVQFYQALIELNQGQMLVLIDNLPPDQAAMAQALRHKVREFDFEPLLEAIKVIVNP